MFATKSSVLLFAALGAAMPQQPPESPAVIVSPIASEPASISSEESQIGAYLSSVVTGTAYSAAASHVRELAIPDGDGLRDLGRQGTNPAQYYSSVPSAVSEFLNSVGSVEQSIYHSTVPPAAVTSSASLFRSQISEVEAYISQLSSEAAISSLTSVLPNVLNLPVLLDMAPLFEEFGGGLPENVKAFVSSVISRENEIYQATVTQVYVSNVNFAFPSTTITEGVYPAASTPTTGASAHSSGPAATGTSSSSSAAAAPTALGCGGSCTVMLGAMLGAALGAVAL